MRLFRTIQSNKRSGFTLIELLITIAIVSILAVVAFASYSSAIQKSNRYDIQQSLIEVSQVLERHYSRNGEYTNSITDVSVYSSDTYTISFQNLSSAVYTLSAIPISGSSQADDECGSLTLNYLGTQTPTTSGCWK
jgi:type IV pilus assembly protein PilE